MHYIISKYNFILKLVVYVHLYVFICEKIIEYQIMHFSISFILNLKYFFYNQNETIQSD